MKKKKVIDWVGEILIGIPLLAITILGILGAVELLNQAGNARNIKLIGFYGILLLMIAKELTYKLNSFWKFRRKP